MTHLKKCPCGKKPKIRYSNIYNEWTVWCPNEYCFTNIVVKNTKQAAIEGWNKREEK
jgi:hypothetical protein